MKNGRHFPDNTFKRIFFNENASILIKISLNFVPKSPVNNISALVQITAWRRPGDKPLSEPMMVSLPTHIWVTWPQWVKLNCMIAPLPVKHSCRIWVNTDLPQWNENPPVKGGFPLQRASNGESISMSLQLHDIAIISVRYWPLLAWILKIECLLKMSVIITIRTFVLNLIMRLHRWVSERKT